MVRSPTSNESCLLWGNLYTTFGRSYTMNPYHQNSLLASVASDSMGITQYTFNTVNQLVGVQKDGLTATYSYLPDGMRSEKTVNGVTTGHLRDGTNMVAETSGDAVVYKYVRTGVGFPAALLSEQECVLSNAIIWNFPLCVYYFSVALIGRAAVMNLNKRDCKIKMRLVPYGGGWTDVYADFGEGELYFIISDVMGESFEILMKALYHLYPNNGDPENAYDLVEYKCGICEYIDGEYVVTRIADDTKNEKLPTVVRDIPWKASFTWDEEGAYSHWTLERTPNEDTSFNLKIIIDVCRNETKHYEYEVPYKDMCYAVAAACTATIKKHGFWGYHHATYTADMNVRYLLFLKSIGLENTEARDLTFYDEKGQGETGRFDKEMELLLFDM